MTCAYGSTFDTLNRQTGFLNALAAAADPIDFWMILGDNFYDKDSSLTTVMPPSTVGCR